VFQKYKNGTHGIWGSGFVSVLWQKGDETAILNYSEFKIEKS